MSTRDVREERLRARYEGAGQGHVLAFADSLAPQARDRLLDQLDAIDLPLVGELAKLAARPATHAVHAKFEPAVVFPLARDERQQARAQAARERGEALLRAGEVAYLLVAGGQASRLGYDGPKGAFPVGPVTGRTLFELFARRLHAARERYGAPPSWYVLTSQANDAATRAFFAEHASFGLDPESIFFFQQAMLPALDARGKILMRARGEVFLAPNGHGGVLAALAASGGLEHARSRGARIFSYFQVDNPLARPADPLFLGLHALEGAQMSSKVVEKRDAAEKVGVIGRVDGRLSCIEYSDLPANLRDLRRSDGELVYGAGNIAIHAIDVAFVAELTRGGLQLPWHVAKKSMSVIDARGESVRMDGFKFETFVFDALAFTKRSVTLEVDRAVEFSPVKNAEGEDSPATARADMCRLYADWIESARLPLPPSDADGVRPVEVDPCLAEDAETFASRAPRAREVTPRGHFYA
jgi:UDP-N-acetylglucosamine/UDP-N-acetylgalactosamine diphosphorylase